MLQPVGPDIWQVPHHFTVFGLPVLTRMTVVRLRDGKLWLHSPVPISPQLREQLDALGEVGYIVAPNKTHHLFVGLCAQAFPDATVFGAPGLARKRPDLHGMRQLGSVAEPDWEDELDQVFVQGVPILNETAWFHRASRTLILTDLCQWHAGASQLLARLYATLTGVRKRLAIPYTIRLMVKDRAALSRSMQKILQWKFERVIVAHHAIVEDDAYQAVEHAFAAVR